MITSLLEASRLGKKQIKLQPIKFDLFGMVKQAAEEFKYLSNQKNLDMRFITNDDKDEIDIIQKKGFILKPHQHFVNEETIVEADKTRIREVIDNLITNAIKYTVTGWIKIWLVKEKDQICVFIKDTGIGIKPEEQDKLFQKFSRVESRSESGLVRPGGTGLGLYVAKSIVEMHGGKINVESKGIKGDGSLFSFSLSKDFKGTLKQSEESSST
jgi:signal transduction histidine kinase